MGRAGVSSLVLSVELISFVSSFLGFSLLIVVFNIGIHSLHTELCSLCYCCLFVVYALTVMKPDGCFDVLLVWISHNLACFVWSLRFSYHTVFVLFETAETNKTQQALQMCQLCVAPIQESSDAEITVSSVFMLARSELCIAPIYTERRKRSIFCKYDCILIQCSLLGCCRNNVDNPSAVSVRHHCLAGQRVWRLVPFRRVCLVVLSAVWLRLARPYIRPCVCLHV